jgi:hypothetical protein
MRTINFHHRVNFYAVTTSRDDYGATSDTYDYTTPSISTRGGLYYRGGSKNLENDEKFYGKSLELTVRYRSSIDETMRVQIDGEKYLYVITYMEVIGRKEGLRLTLEKHDDVISIPDLIPPTGLTVTADAEDYSTIALVWTNNDDGDGVLIERSVDGSVWQQIKRINKASPAVTTYDDTDLEELTRYYYRIRHFYQSQYSPFCDVEYDTTVERATEMEIQSVVFDAEEYEGGDTMTAIVTVKNLGAEGVDVLDWEIEDIGYSVVYSGSTETGVVAKGATVDIDIVVENTEATELEDQEEMVDMQITVTCTLTSTSSGVGLGRRGGDRKSVV